MGEKRSSLIFLSPIKRRKSVEDELAMRELFQEGDLISVRLI